MTVGENTGVIAVVAAHNEAERIAATLAGLREAFPAVVLWVADDGSTDATAGIARADGATVVSMGRRTGKGEAMTAALRRALAAAGGSDAGEGSEAGEGAKAGSANRSAAWDTADDGSEAAVLLCDGDLGASSSRLGPLVQAVLAGAKGGGGEADLAVAAFARRQGGGFGVVVRFARWAVRRRCGLRARAPLSGQRALRADALPRLLPFAAGYGMEVGMTIDAVRAGMRVVEVEIDLAHRATKKTFGGFAHRGRQLLEIVRAERARK
jgi:glycosyltransferase involved in cell wall biosynthesis